MTTGTRPTFSEIIARPHLPALDGLRALAVFTVIFGHANYPVKGVPADLGVSAFFVLSGFLITRLLVREQDTTGGIALSKFYARRTLRIFPAYYAFLALSFVLDHVQGSRWGTGLGASALTYTVNYYNAFNSHPSNSLAHAWSLAVEEQFYLLWPLTFMLLAARGRRRVVWGTCAIALAAVIWRSYLWVAGSDVYYIYNAFDTRLDNLAIGCILALVVDLRPVAGVAERLAYRSWYPLVTIAVLLVSRLKVAEWYHYSIGFTINALLVAILIVQLLQLHDRPVWSWLEHPVTRYLGTISYPLYLYHAWGDAIGRHAPVSGQALHFLAALGGTVLLAAGSYHVIETPFLKLKRRFAASPPPIGPPTVPPFPAPIAPPGVVLGDAGRRNQLTSQPGGD